MIESVLIVLFVLGFFLAVLLKLRRRNFDLFLDRDKSWEDKIIAAAKAKRERKAERMARENNPPGLD